MTTEKDILQRLERNPIELKPLSFSRVDADVPDIDVMYDITWDGRSGYRFIAAVKARATSQALAVAATQMKSSAYDSGGRNPLVIVPFLSPASLDEVERLGISAVDLCGNGIVQVPRQWLVVRSGKPNRFRSSDPLRGTYRGVASLVARAFVANPMFERVGDILTFIQDRGGRTTLATVSKALSRLEEDLIVAREGKSLRLLQPEKLLTRLQDEYHPPDVITKLLLKEPTSGAGLSQRLRAAATAAGGRIAPTGIASASRQAVIATEPVVSFYCSVPPEELARAASLNPQPEKFFPTIELLQTDDERVFFDIRVDNDDLIASPVQTWLELATGDKRSREVANTLRARLVRELEQKREANSGG